MTSRSIETFAVYELTGAGSEEDAHVEAIGITGYTVVPEVLDERQLSDAREKIEAIYAVQLEEVGGEEVVRRINDEHVVRAPLAYDEFFLDVARSPRVVEIVGRLLRGGYFQLASQNAIINVPIAGQGQAAGAWHRDLNYQHFVSSRPLAVSALFCIDDFSAFTGGTHMLPGSHKAEAFPSPAFIERQAVQIEAPAGSVVVFDSMVYHRGGLNTSRGSRRAINHMYTAPMLKQQIDLPALLDGKYEDDPALRRLLGYESRPDASAKQFRLKRLARLDSQP